jgi:hypothetical protein
VSSLPSSPTVSPERLEALDTVKNVVGTLTGIRAIESIAEALSTPVVVGLASSALIESAGLWGMFVNFLQLCFSQLSKVVGLSEAVVMAKIVDLTCKADEADATTVSLELDTAVPESNMSSTIRHRAMRADRPERH